MEIISRKIILSIIIVTMFSCSTVSFLSNKDTSYENAKRLLSIGKYTQAKNEFEFIISNDVLLEYPEAYFYLAEAKYNLKQYLEAKTNYKNYLNLSYREVELSNQAEFMICKCWVNLSNDIKRDQTDTYIALDKLQYYIEKESLEEYYIEIKEMIFELRNKLAKKDFETALLYL